MDTGPRSPVFDALLELNPWASPYWEQRLDLIEAEYWNINHQNQAGNQDTRSWLQPFFKARSDATLDRLIAGDHPAWNRGIYEVVAPLYQDRDFAAAAVGTPMKAVPGGALINTDRQVAGYSLSQFKADVLLLAQPSLFEVRVSAQLEVSNLSFVIGPYIYVSEFDSVIAHETRFGPYADFVSCRFGQFDAAGAEFFDQVSFTPSGFTGDAVFTGAEFWGGASFQGVSFGAAADFTSAKFAEWTAFAGSVFEQTARFRDAQFKGDVTFESVTFNRSADFADAAFGAGVGTAGIVDKEVVAMITAAQDR